MPPDSRLWIGAGNDSWRLRDPDRINIPSVRVKWGETTEAKLIFEPRDPNQP